LGCWKLNLRRVADGTAPWGVQKHLASGVIRGIGPACAMRLVRVFGEAAFDMVEASPERLR
jgi:exodeoxyribonuclease V alpha subunit